MCCRKMIQSLLVVLWHLSLVEAFNRQYFQDICSNVTAGNYELQKVQNDWKEWVDKKYVEIRCLPAVACPGGQNPAMKILTRDDVGTKKFTSNPQDMCTVTFKRSSRTFGQIMRMLQGFQSLEIGNTPPLQKLSPHYQIRIEFSDGTYTFRMANQGVTLGRQILMFFPGRGNGIPYDTAAAALDKLMFKNPRDPQIAEKLMFKTMVERIIDMWNTPTAFYPKWKSTGATAILGKAFEHILDFHVLFFVAESVFPVQPYLSKMKDMCNKAASMSSRPQQSHAPVTADAVKKWGWLDNQSGRTPEIFQKVILGELEYAEAGCLKGGGMVTFKNFIEVKLPAIGILFHQKRGTKYQRIMFYSDLFDLKWTEDDIQKIAGTGGNTIAQSNIAGQGAAARASNLKPKALGFVSGSSASCMATRGKKQTDAHVELVTLGRRLQARPIPKGKGSPSQPKGKSSPSQPKGKGSPSKPKQQGTPKKPSKQNIAGKGKGSPSKPKKQGTPKKPRG